MFIQWTIFISSVTLILGESTLQRIVGGNPVAISAVPWQASLQYFRSHVCGAVIYSDQIVITAAHCFKSDIRLLYSVRVGTAIKQTGGQVVKVSAIRKHESFKRFPNGNLDNDIAVIRLKSRLSLGANISPIPLADSSPAVGSVASVSGWGKIDPLLPFSIKLREVSINIVDSNDCQRSFENINQNMICAAAPGKSPCMGDSGGPLVSGGKLVGIVSYGRECGHQKYPVVFANVSQLKPWILSTINSL
ncbi:trypsin alpha-like [Drosophila elegans]|uniref:trypsin alpha-like n=1 Tax=Drosophila elegans TaxID=30023 RepID=UPI001BC8363A|nr:trypsin alpha-like [Drosophila elegans]